MIQGCARLARGDCARAHREATTPSARGRPGAGVRILLLHDRTNRNLASGRWYGEDGDGDGDSDSDGERR
jgi:hypothetical protein